ncbi:MAG: hypothetical protein IKV13_02605 [Akkermansia sp.]|nr:hypothetical protein [Akkermansia sp.]
MQEVPIVLGFTAGELSPWLSTRCDLQAYQRGAALIRNFQIQPYGGIQLRAGTAYVGEAAGAAVRLFPFCFAENDTLLLEFFPGGMRVYRDAKLLHDASGEVYVLPTPWTGEEQLASLHFSQVNDALYVCCPTHPPVVLYRYADTDWRCDEPQFESMPRETYALQAGTLAVMFQPEGKTADLTLSGGDKHFTADMVGRECLLADAYIPGRELFSNEAQQFSASAAPDIRTNEVKKGTMLHQKHAGTGYYYFYHCIRDYTPDAYNGSNALSDYPYYFQPGFMRLDASGIPYEVAGDWEINTNNTWSAQWELWRSYDTLETEPDFRLWNWTCIKTFAQSDFATRQNWALSGSEERPCRMVLVCRCCKDSAGVSAHLQFCIKGGTREYKFRITEVIDDTHARGELVRSYLGNPVSFSTRSWSFSAIGVRNGYPAFSCMFQGRLWLGGMPGLPTTLLASATDDYHNFRVGSNDDAAMHLNITGSDQSRICWLCATRQLLVGTADSEWIVASGTGGALIPTSVSFRRQSSVGSAAMPARAVENTVLFVQRGGRRLREIAYRLESDGFSATDISMLAEHLLSQGVREWCVQRGSNINIWVLMNDDSLAVLTINMEQQVTAWQRVEMSNRRVLHITALQSKSGKDDEVWFVTQPEQGANPILERMQTDERHLDCYQRVVAEVDGILQVPHLPPDTRILVQEVQGSGVFTSTAGSCVSPIIRTGREYLAGIPIEAELHTMPLEGNMSFNSVRQLSRFKVRLLHSDTSFDYCSTANDRWEHYNGTGSEYTGALRLPLMPDAGVGQSLCIRYCGLHDFRLLAITQEVDHHGK